MGYAVAKFVEALRYKPESYWVIAIFHWLNPSGRNVAQRL
jgi:hypothetical protein